MKKIINDPRHVVREMLEGAVSRSPGQALLSDQNVVVRKRHDGDSTVAILSGGGSGHEPAHAGYVGEGLLAAAIAGDVFTSPSVDAVLAALRVVGGPAGAVLVVKNYTGDRLNFGLAAEIARSEGIPVEVVTVADDVALRDTVAPDKRRGIAGTVLIHKVVGAASAAGKSLADVAASGRRAVAGLGSMGVALGSCTVPAAGRPGFELGEQEVEYGLGIHGEPGVRKGPIATADGLADTVLTSIIDDLGLARGQRVALLVNGLGATPPMELDILLRSALRFLEARGMEVARAWCGNFLTALDMPGASLSLLKVDDELLALLDAPASAPAWPGGGKLNDAPVLQVEHASDEALAITAPTPMGDAVRKASHAAARALLAAEDELTELDTKAGDGDLGASLRRGAEAILELPDHAWHTPAMALRSMADAVRKAIGGSSGPFYATGLMRAARELDGVDDPQPLQWHDALLTATDAIAELGGAKAGDRTMLDALYPAAQGYKEALDAGMSASQALEAMHAGASRGADETATLRANAGRAAYLGERAMGVRDGGAVAVGIWMGALGAPGHDPR